jgi:hypothetical protein
MLDRLISRRPSPALIVAIVALVMAATGFAVAAIPGSDGKLSACYHKTTGAMRLVDETAKCKKTERRIAWNQVGQQGAQGLQGPKGDPGSPGGNGKDGKDGGVGPTGPSGTGGTGGAGGAEVFRNAVAGLTQTNSTSFVSADGPSVTVTIPAGGAFVMVHGEAMVSQAAEDCSSTIGVFQDSDQLASLKGNSASETTGPAKVRFHTSEGWDWLDAGTYTYSMKYKTDCVSTAPQASFTDRKLQVAVIK